MRIKTLFLAIFFIYCNTRILMAQEDLSGNYYVTGYFFHPSSPRPVNLTKTITQISTNSYQVNYLGDLAGWGFQFSIDAGNHLINWVALGSTYPAPASGFMTADNPGSFIFPGPPYPGTSPWLQSLYNNTYNPVTHTFYMHYGYSVSAANQNGYDRQVYEQYIVESAAKITSVSPLTGTSFSTITIKGTHLKNVDPAAAYSIHFGNRLPDTAYIVSDTKIIAKLASGASGDVTLNDIYNNKDTFPGFVYTPVAPITNPQWNYVGKAGFSLNSVYYVSTAIGRNNKPYVAFVDSVSRKLNVMKFNGISWAAVGGDVSEGHSGYTDIAITSDNKPVVAYVDSANSGYITVKKYNGSEWELLGEAGFAYAGGNSQSPFSMALDNANIPYILSYPYNMSVYKFKNNKWITVGQQVFAVSGFGQANITIDKISNKPYVIFDDSTNSGSNGYQATVMKYNGGNWVVVGKPQFTVGRFGIFFPDIQIDTAGNPIASIQEDNGFERQSVYKYKTGGWKPVGYRRFSRGRAYFGSLNIDNKNNVFVLFYDYSYNGQGTVMKFYSSSGKWDTVGARGFIPVSHSFERHTLIFDTSNTPMVAFSDKNYGGKISVMKFNQAFQTQIAELESRDNSAAKSYADITIFPNPSNGLITIHFVAADSKTKLQIINEKGQPVFQRLIYSSIGNNTCNVNISGVPAGTYILTLQTKQEVYNKTFIKK